MFDLHAAFIADSGPGMAASSSGKRLVSLFLAGDVMLARGVDMIQKISCDPVLYEGNGLNAHGYVRLAEEVNGRIPDPAKRGPGYVWGAALGVLQVGKHGNTRPAGLPFILELKYLDMHKNSCYLQKTFWNTFSWIKIVFWYEFNWMFFLRLNWQL